MNIQPQRQPNNPTQTPAWTALAPKRQKEKIVMAGADGRMRAYSEEARQNIWESEELEEAENFLLTDDVVLSQGRDSVSAISLSDGQTLWTAQERRSLMTATDRVVLMQGRGELQARATEKGDVVWASDLVTAALPQGDRVFAVAKDANRKGITRLEARRLDDGEVLWASSDGEIKHLVSQEDGLVYSAQKLGKHSQKIELVTSRDSSGNIRWTRQARGLLRQAPILSPNGEKICLTGVNPGDPSKSFVSVLDAATGETLLNAETAHDVGVSFLPDGGLALAESDFSRIPGNEETRLRVLDSNGDERWRQEPKPDWFSAGEQILIRRGQDLSALSPRDGSSLWNKEFPTELRPLSHDEKGLTLIKGRCQILTLDPQNGELLDQVSTGDAVFVGKEPGEVLVSDHEGRFWSEKLDLNPDSRFVGKWKEEKPFHIPFLSGPIKRGESEAVFADWDGDEKGTDSDPILVDQDHQIVSWEQLNKRDSDNDQRLESEQLNDLSLWFDNDKDGKVSSERELDPLISERTFDKARMELSENRLWVASDSRC